MLDSNPRSFVTIRGWFLYVAFCIQDLDYLRLGRCVNVWGREGGGGFKRHASSLYSSSSLCRSQLLSFMTVKQAVSIRFIRIHTRPCSYSLISHRKEEGAVEARNCSSFPSKLQLQSFIRWQLLGQAVNRDSYTRDDSAVMRVARNERVQDDSRVVPMLRSWQLRKKCFCQSAA